MDRQTKEAFVAEIKEAFDASSMIVVTRQTGVTVSESEKLRTSVRESGATHRIAKNRLVKLAIQESGIEALTEYFVGPTAITYGEDAVATAKAVSEFAKGNDKVEVLGGAMDGKVLSAAEVDTLAKLPSLDQLRGQLVGLLNAPAGKIVGVVNAPGAQLARLLTAYSEKEAA